MHFNKIIQVNRRIHAGNYYKGIHGYSAGLSTTPPKYGINVDHKIYSYSITAALDLYKTKRSDIRYYNENPYDKKFIDYKLPLEYALIHRYTDLSRYPIRSLNFDGSDNAYDPPTYHIPVMPCLSTLFIGLTQPSNLKSISSIRTITYNYFTNFDTKYIRGIGANLQNLIVETQYGIDLSFIKDTKIYYLQYSFGPMQLTHIPNTLRIFSIDNNYSRYNQLVAQISKDNIVELLVLHKYSNIVYSFPHCIGILVKMKPKNLEYQIIPYKKQYIIFLDYSKRERLMNLVKYVENID